MSTLRKSSDGSDQRPPGSAAAQGTAWLEALEIKNKEGELWGWSNKWAIREAGKLKVAIIPRLCLSPRPTYQLVHVRGYLDVFQGCQLHSPGLEATPFLMIGAVFPLYKTGQPELHQMIASIRGGFADLAKIIELGTSVLTEA